MKKSIQKTTAARKTIVTAQAPTNGGQPVAITLTLPADAHARLADLQERTGLTAGNFLESALDAIQQQLESAQARPLAA